MIRINLLPVRAERRRESVRKNALMMLLCLVVVVAVMASLIMHQRSSIKTMTKKIKAREAEIAQLDKVIAEVKDYEKKKDDLSEKIAAINMLEERQRGPAKMFYELATLCPDKLWLDKVTDQQGQVKIQGFASDNQTIARFMTSLEKSSMFAKVRLVESKQTVKSEIALKSFTLTTTISYPKAPDAAKDKQAPGQKKAG